MQKLLVNKRFQTHRAGQAGLVDVWMNGLLRRRPRAALPSINPALGLGVVLALLATAPVSTRAVEDPPGCSLASGGAGNTSQGGVNFNLLQAHVGDAVPVFTSLGMANRACRAINATGVVYVATGPLTNFLANVTLDPGTLVSCPGAGLCQPGPYHILITPALVGAPVNTPLGGVPGVAKTVRAVENGFGTVLAGVFNEQLSDFHSASISIVAPCLQVFKTCDLPAGQECFAAETPVRFRGYVTNCGDITLTNVAVVDSRSGAVALFNPTNGAALTGNVSLPPGAYAVFSNSFLPTLAETCAGSAASAITATARDTTVIGGPNAAVTNALTAACPICVQPGLAVTKNCPAAAGAPGAVLTFTGAVTNTGNLTLTNVTILNSRLLTNGSALVASFPTLAPAEVRTFSGSYVVPADVCALTDTLTANGFAACGTPVTASVTRTCAVTNTARIAVTKRCPVTPVAPGELANISGVVSNAGNITLTNVVVVDNVPVDNTVLLGPISLAPGQAANYTGSFRVPLDCCTYVDTVTATGASFCPGVNVAATATAVCPTATTPRLAVDRKCPAQPVPLGEPLNFTGTVSNAGNITLTDVVVVNTIPTNNAPLLGPLTLAPGEVVAFIGSCLVPLDTCATNLSDTVTARAVSICGGTNVSASQFASCSIRTTPRLVLTKHCPASPVAPGGLLTFSGSVSNAGSVTLTNVLVVNDHPTNHTPVLGPLTLAPGQATNFSGGYFVCADCCPPYVDTLRATGAQICNGSNVAATATASCPGVTAPQLSLVVDCPPAETRVGQLAFYTGSVSNAGNVTVRDLLLTDNQAGFVAQFSTLAPTETADFFGFYVATNCGEAVATAVTATGFDLCLGGGVSQQATAACAIACGDFQALVLLNPHMTGGQFRFAFDTAEGRAYTVECSDAVPPVNWQPLTNCAGTGSPWTFTAPAAAQQRFYRVRLQ